MKANKEEFKEYKESEEFKERSEEKLSGQSPARPEKADLSRRRPCGGGN